MVEINYLIFPHLTLPTLKWRMKCYFFFYPDDDVTVGKFYATYLIQEYFRRFKARQKAQDQANEVQGNSTVALQVSVGDWTSLIRLLFLTDQVWHDYYFDC